jgi:integrase
LSAAIGAWHRRYNLDSRPLITLPDRGKGHPDWLTDAEYQRMLRVVRGERIIGGSHAKGFEWDGGGEAVPHAERFIELAFATGSRSGVMLALGWGPDPEGMRGHIDFATTTIFRIGPNAPRTKKRGDPCRIPDRLLPILRQWHDADMAEKAKVEKAGGEWVDRIVRYRGGSLARIGQSFERIARDARLEIRDIDKRDRIKDKALGMPTPHILRHSRATLLLRAGVAPHEVAEFLSMSLKMLLETYGHHHVEYQKAAAAAA